MFLYHYFQLAVSVAVCATVSTFGICMYQYLRNVQIIRERGQSAKLAIQTLRNHLEDIQQAEGDVSRMIIYEWCLRCGLTTASCL